MTTLSGRSSAALLLVACALPLAPAQAAETILSFHSAITVHADSSMTVRETIRVRAEGRQIKRGIYRDFPTRYKDRYGNTYSVDFRVVSVERDGRTESYHTKSLSNGVRVYMGKKDVYLRPGIFTYALTYRANRQLGFFKNHDELYWNVTGNGWDFPIDAAGARVTLPSGVPDASLTLEGYTGPQGAKGRDYSAVVNTEGQAVFSSTTRLRAHEGLTIVVGWPKGYVREPSAKQRFSFFIADNRSFLLGSGGLLALLVYYLAAWVRVGQDPDKGAIVPSFTPPHDLSPAAMRYIRRMSFDHKTFASAVLNLAVKGYLAIDEEKKNYTLIKQLNSNKAKLTPRETKMGEKLFGHSDRITLKNINHQKISAAIKQLKSMLSTEFHKVYFFTNRGYLVIGLLITLATFFISGSMAAQDKEGFLGMSVWLSVWTGGVAFLWIARQYLMAVAFTFFEFVGIFMFQQIAPLWVTGLLVSLVIVNLMFYYLLKAPTRAGRKIMDAIEGFRMYLAAAEKDRLNLLHPPEKTPELFEKYLPYAFALDVEHEWSEQFTEVLKHAGSAEGSYRPSWYHGSSWSRRGPSGFASSLGSSLSSAISSSSHAPGSSSGGGGGGSSGGGGGGGGGGGW